ncbi:hypothetical protein DL98DRAFT_594897 [Cadophora sp. DSE1049]|nr:hypothetical protein DL98DRAFT_594897 [Cadophora sp. DSE1049]
MKLFALLAVSFAIFDVAVPIPADPGDLGAGKIAPIGPIKISGHFNYSSNNPKTLHVSLGPAPVQGYGVMPKLRHFCILVRTRSPSAQVFIVVIKIADFRFLCI